MADRPGPAGPAGRRRPRVADLLHRREEGPGSSTAATTSASSPSTRRSRRSPTCSGTGGSPPASTSTSCAGASAGCASCPSRSCASSPRCPCKNANPMDVLRTAVSALAVYEPAETQPGSSSIGGALRLTAVLPTILGYYHRTGGPPPARAEPRPLPFGLDPQRDPGTEGSELDTGARRRAHPARRPRVSTHRRSARA